MDKNPLDQLLESLADGADRNVIDDMICDLIDYDPKCLKTDYWISNTFIKT